MLISNKDNETNIDDEDQKSETKTVKTAYDAITFRLKNN